MKFEVLYHFSQGLIHLVETKRLDLPECATPSEVYRWSLVNDGVVKALTFQSMTLHPQKRIFLEGEITFDLNSCQACLFGQTFELIRHEGLSERLRLLLQENVFING